MSHQTPAPKQNQRKILPDLETLDRLLRLDPETGILWWRVKVPKMRPGGHAGSVKGPRGYSAVLVCGIMYPVHRLVWKLHWREEPPEYIDHKNGIKTDNRPCNLRVATAAENQANAKTPRNNTSGIKGVCYHKTIKKWMASIHLNGKDICLGYYPTKEEAGTVVQAAREKAHGEFARHE